MVKIILINNRIVLIDLQNKKIINSFEIWQHERQAMNEDLADH